MSAAETATQKAAPTPSTPIFGLEDFKRWFREAEINRQPAQALSVRDRDYYDNNQWSKDELEILKERKQPPIVKNRIKPRIDGLLGAEKSQRTQPKAFPRNPEFDENSANAASDALKYVTEKNNFDQSRSSVFENMTIEGDGGVEIVVENIKGKPEIIIRNVPWDRLFRDPHSRRRDATDAMYRGIVRWADRDALVLEYPDKKNEIAAYYSEVGQLGNVYSDQPNPMWADPQRKRIQVIELWWKEGNVFRPDAVKRVVFIEGAILEEPIDSPYQDEDGTPIDSLEMATGYIDRHGNTYGLVRQMIGSQDEINKRSSKGLHLLNTVQVVGEKGAVEDINRARKELARPDGYVETMPGMNFKVERNLDLAQAHFQMLQEAKSEIDAIGPNPTLTGKGTGGMDMSGRALQSRQQTGMMELGPLFDERTRFTREVFRHVWCLIKQYWTGPKWIRVTDNEKNIKFVGLNRPVPLGQMLMDAIQGKEPLPQELETDPRFGPVVQMAKQAAASRDVGMMRQLFMHPIMNQPVKIENNVGALDVDIIVTDEPENVDIQAEQFAHLIELAKIALQNPQGQQIPIDAIIEASSLRNKEQLLEKMNNPQHGNPQEAAQKEALQKHAMLEAQKKADAENERIMAAARKDNAQAAVLEASIPISATTAMKELQSFQTGQEITPEPSALEIAQQIHDSKLKHVETHAKAAKATTEALLNMRELANPAAGDSGASQTVSPTTTGESQAPGAMGQ